MLSVPDVPYALSILLPELVFHPEDFRCREWTGLVYVSDSGSNSIDKNKKDGI